MLRSAPELKILVTTRKPLGLVFGGRFDYRLDLSVPSVPYCPHEMKYGTTPWGAWFVRALEGYDESGRLGRGKSYANTGKVKELAVVSGKAAAKVAGHSRPWYKVTVSFKPFTKTERDRLLEIIRSDPLLLPRIEAGELPGELAEMLEAAGICLMPKRWDDMDRSCSCPDWGDPCKHMAAVYYLLAKEIDQDPRLLFELRGVELRGLLGARGTVGEVEEAQPAIAEPIEWNLVDAPPAGGLSPADGAGYPFPAGGENYAGLVSSLLPKEAAFSGENFAASLIALYHRAARSGYEKAFETDGNVERRFSSARYRVVPAGGRWTKSAPSEPPRLEVTFASGETKTLGLLEAADLFSSFSDGTGSAGYAFLYNLFRLFASFLRSAAFAPAPRLSGKHLSVLWRPLRCVRETGELLERYSELVPPGLLSEGKEPYPSRLSLIELLASACITGWVHRLSAGASACRADVKEAFGLFFIGGSLDVSVPGKRSLPRAVASYLAPLSLDFSSTLFRFTLGYAKGKKKAAEFTLALDYAPKGGTGSRLTALKDAADSPGGTEALKNAAVLGSYLPEIFSLTSRKRICLEESRLARFLSEAEYVLRRLGAEVVLPKALRRELKPRSAIQVEATASKALTGYLGLEEVLNYDRGIALGDRFLSVKEFERLVREKREIVVFRDGFVRIDPSEAARLLEEGKARRPLGPLDLLKARFSGDAVFSADAEEVAASLFREREVPVPASLRGSLRPYQDRGYRWIYTNLMSGFGCVLADDMGLGKTIQAVALMLRLRDEGLAGEGILVVAPAALLTNWERELERFAPSLKVMRYHGAKRSFRERSDVVVTTYATATRDAESLAERNFSLLVADEAHLLKNAATRQSKTIKGFSARYKLALSGTPVENKLEDLRSLFDLVMPGYLGNAEEFKNAYRVPIEVDRNAETAERLKRITAPFLLRRLKTDPSVYPDLPEKTTVDEFAVLSKEQAALYESIVRKGMDDAEKADPEGRLALVLKLLTSLKQVCDHPRVYDKESPAKAALSGKSLLLVELLGQMLDRGEKTLVFSQYVECLDVLRTVVAEELGEECLVYSGRLGQQARSAAVDSFQNDPGRRIMLMSLKAGGLGLNLTAASRVIHYDLWFNPAVENQATDRAFRIGQAKNVFVHRLIAAGTFEERIDAMLKAKRELADMSVASGESWISRMGNEELRELFG